MNSYMPLVGLADASTGELIKLFIISSTNSSYDRNGWTTKILEQDSLGNIYGGIFFGKSPFSVFKILLNSN